MQDSSTPQIEPQATGPKPRIWGIVGLAALKGILGIVSNIGVVDQLNSISSSRYPGWLPPVVYLLIGLGVIALAAAVLVALYRRLGLQLGAVVFGLDVLLGLLLSTSGVFQINIIALALDAVVLYYIYQYLTKEPQRSFFT